MSNQPPDAFAVLREAMAEVSKSTTSFTSAHEPILSLAVAAFARLPALLDELEQLRKCEPASEAYAIEDCGCLSRGKFSGIWRVGVGENYIATFVNKPDADNWLRSDAGKSAVERAKGGQS